jgi:bifunctional DNase/RNase
MATVTDRDFLDMQVSDVRRIVHAGRDHHVVLLQEVGGERRLPIWIGAETAMEFAHRLLGHGGQLTRPLGSDLTVRLVRALGGSLAEVRIDRLADRIFYAVVVVDGPQGRAEVDARPSDALLLALVAGASVRADREMVEAAEASDEVARSFAAADSREAAGARALLEEQAREAERQGPPAPTSP